LLKPLKSSWCPKAFCVSFKLETDESILLKKALGAITNYHVDAVIANNLNTRKSRVTIVTEKSKEVRCSVLSLCIAVLLFDFLSIHPLMLSFLPFQVLERKEHEPEIEEKLVSSIAKMHATFISHSQASSTK
jgi:hypothetical protein